MSAPQFPPRKRLPMPRSLYERLLRDIRAQADMIEARLDPQTPHERKALTQAVGGLRDLAGELSARHLAQIGPDGAWIEPAERSTS